MKRMRRSPEKFEVIDLFDAIGRNCDLKLHDKDSEKAFLESIKTGLGHLRTPIVLHGRRVEAMFGYVSASLGHCAVIKKEDSGDAFVQSSDVRIPDYRIVTQTGDQFLVEVKNCHKTSPASKFSIKSEYLEGLRAYARLFGIDLKFAIYWSRWNEWVLVSATDLRREGSIYVTTFSDSSMHNQMATLGDVTIGTTPPLVFRLLTDPGKPRGIDADGEGTCTIASVEMACAGKLIVEKSERSIAFYLMLFGKWPMDGPHAMIEDGELVSVGYVAEPQEKTPGQGFEMVGTMSGMISRYYNELTAPMGNIERLTPRVEPATLGMSIAADYKGSQLPLWRFILRPAKSDGEGS